MEHNMVSMWVEATGLVDLDPQALTAELLLPKPTQSGKGTSASIFLSIQ